MRNLECKPKEHTWEFSTTATCPECNGRGEIGVAVDYYSGEEQFADCLDCDKSGTVALDECKTCSKKSFIGYGNRRIFFDS